MAVPDHNIGQENQPKYDRIGFANVTMTGSAVQFPNVACSLVNVRARSTNAVVVGVGSTNAVTTTNAWSLAAGESTGWIPINNLNLLWGNAASGVLEVMYC